MSEPNTKLTRIKLSVRDFALPVPRTGSIETHSGYGPTPNVGMEIHQAIQQERLDSVVGYRKEVAIQGRFAVDEFEFQVAGRIDGVIAADELIFEEIKSAFSAKTLLGELERRPDHPYALQLKTYAYLHRMATGESPACRFLIVSARNRLVEELPVAFDVDDYETWLTLRLAELAEEQRELARRIKRRKKLATRMVFPFAHPRPGQKELIATVAESVFAQEQMLIQAPTGLGKTIGVLFPAAKEALARGAQTFYVTPKNSQHAVAQDAVRRLQEDGAAVRQTTITAKTKACLKPEPVCNPGYCEYARDYYEKVDRHRLLEKLGKKRNLTVKQFQDFAHRYEVCPFQLSLDSIAQRDVVICDYNYVFSPNGALKRLFDPEEIAAEQRPNLVIDEAHNLHSRAADYYSPALAGSTIEKMNERMAALPERFATRGTKLIASCLQAIRSARPAHAAPYAKIEPNPAPFIAVDEKLSAFLTEYLESDVEINERDVVLELARYWSDFTASLGQDGDEFFTTYRQTRYGDTIKITCCDAAPKLAEAMKGFNAVVAFSATLKPFRYYAELSGFDAATARTEEFTSPFPRENRKLMIIPQVSTKYRDRERNYGKISEAIRRIVTTRVGNYFVFFPSFEFLERTAEGLAIDGFRLFAQTPEMPAHEAAKIIEATREVEKNALILAVQGGIFSEGIDYPGDTLIGAIIVGPALPNYNLERELIRDYYERNYGDGFDYAYTFPAMAKVIQAAGRVIRSEQDVGLIVLMDQRFLDPTYVKTMPSDWFQDHVKELVSTQILADIQSFWSDRAGETCR